MKFEKKLYVDMLKIIKQLEAMDNELGRVEWYALRGAIHATLTILRSRMPVDSAAFKDIYQTNQSQGEE